MSKGHEQHKPSKDSEQAMREADAHTAKTNSHDAVPGDDTAHAHSEAAHLHEKSKMHEPPQGNAPQGPIPGRERQPPTGVTRTDRSSRE